jgi:hypothetical protein
MEAKDIVLDGLERIRGSVHRTLEGLTLAELHQQPRSDSNSIAWLVWHLTRVQDTSISGLMGQEPLWVSQAWHAKFDLAADAADDGFGNTPEQVSAFRAPSIAGLLNYHDQVAECSKTYVAGLAAEDFDRALNEPQWQPLPTVGVRLVSVISDNLQHAGQVAYLRGLFQGKGWLPY